jgi:hypothetical protein
MLEAEWRPATGLVSEVSRNRSVAAMAASLALPLLDEERAALLAEAEGLVTHLTSLVLVDEAAEVQEGIPAVRKIALPHPSAGSAGTTRSRGYRASYLRIAPRNLHAPRGVPYRAPSIGSLRSPRSLGDLRIDWDMSPIELLAGDLSVLDPQQALLIERAAAQPEVIALAKRMNIDPTILVVALLAQSQASGNRSAARIAKSVIGGHPTNELLKIAELIGLV